MTGTTLKIVSCFFSILTLNSTFSQVVFTETFNEPNNSTSGTDNTGGVSWTSSCATCLSGDHWYVVSGRFEGQDTNGGAIWETSGINVSSCENVEVSFTISESGTLEACGTGCNSGDWVSFQYNVDGSGWQDPSNSFYCSGGCAGINVIAADDLSGGSMSYTTGCIPSGNSMRLRITVQNWAGSEYWRIDNINVACACSSLPIELVSFDAEITENEEVQLWWQTASEVNNDHFTIERSADTKEWEFVAEVDGAGNSIGTIDYSTLDRFPLTGTSYYRLKQTDFDGAYEYADIISVDLSPSGMKVFPNPSNSLITLTGEGFLSDQLSVYNLLGQDVSKVVTLNELADERIVMDVSKLQQGVYIIRSGKHSISFSKL